MANPIASMKEVMTATSQECADRSEYNASGLIHPNVKAVMAAISCDSVPKFEVEITRLSPATAVEATSHSATTLSSATFAAGITNINPQFVCEMIRRYSLRENGANVAHIAAANNAFSVLDHILRLDLNLDIMNSRTRDTQWTPLHFAAFNQCDRTAALLRSSGAELHLVDIYGDKPYEIAKLLGNQMLAEQIGDTSSSFEEKAKKNVQYQQMLAQAKAFELEREREAAERQRAAEERAVLREQFKELVEKTRKLKAKFESGRIEFVRERWLAARQTLERDFISEQFFRVFVDAVTVSMAKSATESKKREQQRVERLRLEAEKSKKKKGKGKGKGGRSKSVASSAPSASQSGSGAAQGDLFDFVLPGEDEPLPELNEKMTKEEKQEVIRLRSKIMKERKARREVEMQRLRDLSDVHAQEQDRVEDECIAEKKEIEISWFASLGAVAQQDPTLDRCHAGFFRYEVFDERYRWSCCGQLDDPLAAGCQPSLDMARAFFHTGSFSFHILECPCGGCKEETGSPTTRGPNATLFASGSQQRMNVKELLKHRISSLGGGSSASETSQRGGRRRGPKTETYCSPGACCWSCCGGTTLKSKGCTPHKRFLVAEHFAVDVRFDPFVSLQDSPQFAPRVIDPTARSKKDNNGNPDGSSLLSAKELSIALHSKSQLIASEALASGGDPESLSIVHRVVGKASAEDWSSADAEAGDAASDVAVEEPQDAYIMYGADIRVSHCGRRIEHIGSGTNSRVNLLGNVVLRPEFLADCRRRAAEDGTMFLESKKSLHLLNARQVSSGPLGSVTQNIPFAPQSQETSPKPAKAASKFKQRVLRHFSFGGEGAEEDPIAMETSFGGSLNDFDSSSRSPLHNSNNIGSRTAMKDLLPEFESHGEIATMQQGSYAVYGFEVRLTRLPPLLSTAAERAVIGLALATLPDDVVEGEEPTDADDVDDSEASRGEESDGDVFEERNSESGEDKKGKVLKDASAAFLAAKRRQKNKLAAFRAQNGTSPAALCPTETVAAPPMDPNAMTSIPHQTKRFVCDANTKKYISTGSWSIGWWTHSGTLKGLGHNIELENPLCEKDILFFAIDAMNSALHIFHNRAHARSLRIDTTVGYVPAMTLVAGCRVDVEYFGSSTLPYFEKWMREKAALERMLRLTVDARGMEAKLLSVEEARKKASLRGGAPSSSPTRKKGGKESASDMMLRVEDEVQILY